MSPPRAPAARFACSFSSAASGGSADSRARAPQVGPHPEWGNAHTVWGEVEPASMDIIDRIVNELPVKKEAREPAFSAPAPPRGLLTPWCGLERPGRFLTPARPRRDRTAGQVWGETHVTTLVTPLPFHLSADS